MGMLLGSCMDNPKGLDTGELAKLAAANSQSALAKCEALDRRVTALEAQARAGSPSAKRPSPR